MYGAKAAAIGTVVCNMITFVISYVVLRKNIKFKLKFSKFILKPTLATIMMSVCSFYTYHILSSIILEKLATIISISVAVIIYCLAVIVLKVLDKEEIYMLPNGEKIYNFLIMIGIYSKKEI